MQFLTNTNFDFIGKVRYAVVFSAILIVAGVGSLVFRGGPALSIDFRGGTILEVRITPAAEVSDVRDALARAGLDARQVQEFGAPTDLLIQLPADSDLSRNLSDVLEENLPGHEVEQRRQETVGPKIGTELRRAAINSIFVALILIVLYISLRFVFQFAVGAVAALVHDVLITLGIFSLFDKEISLTIVAAFLTIIGYSLNDTIVVFDRIRENMGLRRRESYEGVINKSINETLSRTLITSVTTMLVALILYFAGGAVIHDFAFALVIGVLIGTYSSIFVASPVLIAWYKWRSSDRKRTTPRSKAQVPA